MEIDTSGKVSDVASWRDFWEVAVAINGMCIRQGREGFQINIGTRALVSIRLQRVLISRLGGRGGLRMELKDNRNPAAVLSSS